MLLNFLAGCALCCVGVQYIDTLPESEKQAHLEVRWRNIEVCRHVKATWLVFMTQTQNPAEVWQPSHWIASEESIVRGRGGE